VISDILMDIEAEISEVEKGSLKDLNIAKFVVPEVVSIDLEVPRSILQIKEKGKARLIISTNPDIEYNVDCLFRCMVYNIEKVKRGKEEKTLVYGSVGGLQVRIEGKGLHRKFKAGDKVYLGIKLL
jgi:hypothetical protein